MNFIKQNRKDMAKLEIQSSGVNIICDGASIKGDIIANNDLRIDGTINGNIVTSGRVVVGEQGSITGDIKCNTFEIFGLVKGCVEAEDSVCMKGDAKFYGDVTTKHLSIEPSVLFSGFCKMGNTNNMSNQESFVKHNELLLEEKESEFLSN